MTRHGFIFITSLAIAVFLTVVGASLLIRSVSETSLSERSGNQSAALHLADAAIDQAAVHLRIADVSPIALTSAPTGTFWAEITTLVPDQTQQVIAHGRAAGEQRNVESIVTLVPASVFQFALFGSQTVNVGGSAITDSYNSMDGVYDPSSHDHNGDIGTNSTSAGGVTVGGSIFIDGQVAVGPDVANPQSVVTGYNSAFITGGTSPPSDTQDVVSQSNVFPMTPVTVPAGLSCSDKTVTGGTTEILSSTGGPLGNGTYCFDDLTIQGNADLTSDGKVTIYLTGELTAKGNSTVGVVDDPTQMRFLLSSTAEATLEQTITGSNTFYGAIYGPAATFTITGNAEVYGSIIAKRVNLTGSATIHYDEALTQTTDISNSYTTSVVSWREL